MQHQRSSSLLLCIETSGSLCGIAIADADSTTLPGGSLIAELSFSEPFLHDKLLAEATRSLCTMADITLPNLSAVAVSAGPGSFTGLRIGAAFAKALCFENLPKLIAVPTLEAIALAAAPSARMLGRERICVGIPSHKHLVYVQYFTPEAAPLGAIALVSEEEFTPNPSIFYAGAAFDHKPAYTTLPDYCRITPAMIAALGVEHFRKQAFMLSEDFVPLYAQEFVPKNAQ